MFFVLFSGFASLFSGFTSLFSGFMSLFSGIKLVSHRFTTRKWHTYDPQMAYLWPANGILMTRKRHTYDMSYRAEIRQWYVDLFVHFPSRFKSNRCRRHRLCPQWRVNTWLGWPKEPFAISGLQWACYIQCEWFCIFLNLLRSKGWKAGGILLGRPPG